ncbi:uncharacterized protein [Dysidea avara]|uniref:uncharacterized protein n=1 Tax=Dysidea avara TaxID=196820 RepID=UPI003331A691
MQPVSANFMTLESHIRGLEALGKTKDTFGDFLIPIIFRRLPSAVRRNLTRDHTSEEWNIDEVRRAIEKEIIVLESGLDNQGDSGRSTITGSFLTGIRKGQSGQQLADKRFVSAKPTCVYCKGLHSSAQCNIVVDVKARLEVVKRERLCFNCLGSHRAMNCNSKNRCRLCHKKHHTTLCGMDNPLISGATTVRQQNVTSQPPQTSQASPPLTSQAPQGSLNPASNSFVPTQQHISEYTMATQLLLVVKRNPQCLLKTAIALVRVGNKRISANVLFDEGAQRSFVTETLAAQLGASPHHKESLAISSFGGSTSLNNQVSLVNFILETTEGDIKISALVVPKIAAPIENFVRSDLHNLPHLRGLTLAQPVSSAEKFEISLLFGVDYYWEIVGNHITSTGKRSYCYAVKVGILTVRTITNTIRINCRITSLLHNANI